MFKTAVRKIYRTILPYAARRKLFALRHELSLRLSGRCDVCRSHNFARFTNATIARLESSFYRCRNCGFIFVHPKPNITEVYGEGAIAAMGSSAAVWNASFLAGVEKYDEARGRLLEIGFGDAGFLQLAHERGWDVHGAELSRPCVHHAGDVLGLPNIKYGTVEDINYPNDFFDVVAAFNFIEHVPDPRATLGELRRILRPGGLLALLCPNMAGLYHRIVPEIFGDNDPLNLSWVPPFHLSYFDRHNFRQLLESCGFEVAGDESERTPALWLQQEVSVGLEVTDKKLSLLLSEIKSSPLAGGEVKEEAFRGRVREVLFQRLAWALGTDVMKLEAALGAENAIFYISRKRGAAAAPGASV